MNVEKLKEMSNRDLLELYELMVRVNHYDLRWDTKRSQRDVWSKYQLWNDWWNHFREDGKSLKNSYTKPEMVV